MKMSLVLFLLLAVTGLARAQITGCDDELLLSQGPPLDQIVVSQTARSTTFQNAVHFGRNNNLETWCTTINDPNPFIRLNFFEPVVITSFLSSDTTAPGPGLGVSFGVTNFSISYWDSDTIADNMTGSFVDYTTPEGDTKYFEQRRTTQFFQLDPPITTSVLIFRQLEAFDSTGGDLMCQGVGLIGCTAANAATPAEPTTMVTTNGTTSRPSEVTAQQIIIQNYLVLDILLPIALITILVVTAIVVVGVVICLRSGKHSHSYEIPMGSVQPLSPGAARTVDNTELYTAPSEIDGYINMADAKRDLDSPQYSGDRRRSTIWKLDNPIYGSPREISTEADGSQKAELIYSEPNEQTAVDSIELIYSDEPIEQDTLYSEPIHNHTQRDSMAENPYYGREDIDPLEHSFAYNIDNNSSYGRVEEMEAVENIYEEPSP